MFAKASAPSRLSFQREDAAELAAADAVIRQSIFLPVATVPVEGRLVALRFEGADENLQLRVIDGANERTWSFSGGEPQLAGVLALGEDSGSIDETAAFRRMAHALRSAGWMTMPMMDAPPAASGQMPVLARRGSEFALLDIADAATPQTIQTYSDEPWFAHSSSAGTMLARFDERAGHVTLYRSVDEHRSPDLDTLTQVEQCNSQKH